MEFVVDFRFPKKDGKPCAFLVHDGKDGHVRVTIAPDGKIENTFKDVIHTQPGVHNEESSKGALAVLKPVGQWNRLQVTDAGATFKVTVNGAEVTELSAAVSPRGERSFSVLPGKWTSPTCSCAS